MNLCQRETELLESLGRGYVGPELVSHVAECASCRKLQQVAGALLDERINAMTEAPVPSAATMWFRMQVRRQQEVQAAARHSFMIGQAATLVIALALIGSVFGADAAVSVLDVISAIRVSTPLLIAVGTWLLLAPIAGYFAIKTTR